MAIDVLNDIIVPAHVALVPFKIPDSDSAQAMSYAIGLQESQLTYRYQLLVGVYPRGPARGLWQFESGGGVKGVLTHQATREAATHFARLHVGSVEPLAVWVALEHIDALAAIFARLLLWTDPRPLPAAATASEGEAYAYYERNWRPGKPHPEAWPARWAAALGMVASAKLTSEAQTSP